MRKHLAQILALCLLAPTLALADYDLADNFRPIRITASALQTTFAGTWPVETEAQVKVYVSADAGSTYTLKTLDTDYTVTGEGGVSGFNVVFNSGVALNSIVILDRDSGIDRPSDLTTIEPVGVNTHMDRMTMGDQETEDIARRRSIQLRFGDDYNDGEGDTFVNPVLPEVDADAVGKAICVTDDASPNTYGMAWCSVGEVDSDGACCEAPVPEADICRQFMSSDGAGTQSWATVVQPIGPIFKAGKPGAGEIVWMEKLERPLTIPAGFGFTEALALTGATSTATYKVYAAPAGGATFTEIGSVIWGGGESGSFATVPTMTTVSVVDETYQAGVTIKVVAPSSQDATLANVTFAIYAYVGCAVAPG